ncbi:GNAT family N-acetyltransferase [candidate division KSB1 bacterium]|nr:GNAT family N-acetyltransferase [candidate division KSB1 bacterium]
MVKNDPVIKEIVSTEQLLESVSVLQNSFETVARLYKLTEQNCPTNAAFITAEKLISLKQKPVIMFGLYENSRQIGFVALEKSTSKNHVYYLEKLAVLPEYRHRGYGNLLMDHCVNYVRDHAGEKISIGIIFEHQLLKKWYENYGFVSTGLKSFKHLPFTVCFMEKTIEP